jgi:hypothetical protein
MKLSYNQLIGKIILILYGRFVTVVEGMLVLWFEIICNGCSANNKEKCSFKNKIEIN